MQFLIVKFWNFDILYFSDRSPGDNDFSSKNIAGKAETVKYENGSYLVVGINNNTTANEQKYRSKQEIYNEIVCECAQLEKNMVFFQRFFLNPKTFLPDVK